MAKFWIHISREEQLRRFEERKAIGYKAWKLTEEDWRNREKWGAYEEAVEQMLVKTSTTTAPWTLIEGNDKYWARTKVLAKLVKILSTEMGHQPADPLRRHLAETPRKKSLQAKTEAACTARFRWLLRHSKVGPKSVVTLGEEFWHHAVAVEISS